MTTEPGSPTTSHPPLRVISMAWGEKFVDEFLELCLPALLAPGNLPLIAKHFSTELVLVTEARLFDQVNKHHAIERAARICRIRLVSLDDLIATPGSYGMSITYALYRGFEDLGTAMTDCYLLFLNSDFILAENSYKGLLPHLLSGERLILAPSYCTSAEDALPEILPAKDVKSSVMAIAPRRLADIILRHRHVTIRTKTVNQRIYSLNQIDQFYMAVDETTLLGYQFPIAVVAMKPECQPPAINSYWDYDLIAQFCPSLQYSVLADSDEFLMLELRERNRASQDVVLGWPTPQQIAGQLRNVVTNYSIAVGGNQLILHSQDIPDGIIKFSAELKAFVDSVVAELLPLPHYIFHPQWTYHYPGFNQAREKHLELEYLAGNSVPKTQMVRVEEPDNIAGSDDSVRRDNQRPGFSEFSISSNAGLGVEPLSAIRLAYASQEDYGDAQPGTVKALNNLLGQWLRNKQRLAILESETSAFSEAARTLRANTPVASGATPYAVAASNDLSELNRKLAQMGNSILELREAASAIGVTITKLLDSEVLRGLDRIHFLLEAIEEQRRENPAGEGYQAEDGTPPTASPSPTLVRKAWQFLFGTAPEYRPWHWLHPATSTTCGIVEELARKSNRALLVSGPHTLNFFKCSGVAVTTVPLSAVRPNFHYALPKLGALKFDLCLVDAAFSDIMSFRATYDALRPVLRSGGTIIAFFLNAKGQPIPLEQNKFPHDALPTCPPMRIIYAGGWFSMAAIKVRVSIERVLRSVRIPETICAALSIVAASPFALAGTMFSYSENALASPNKNATSITLMVDVG